LNTFAILLCFLNSLIMATIVIMPKQGQSVESCIITEINKNTGDEVKAGDILFTYETDKASFEGPTGVTISSRRLAAPLNEVVVV
jgi:hypothetical protein